MSKVEEVADCDLSDPHHRALLVLALATRPVEWRLVAC